MFNFFKKKDPGISVTDKVVISQQAKLKAMFTAWENNKNIIFIFWFDESLEGAARFFLGLSTEPVLLFTAREVSAAQLTGKTACFAEHYPLKTKEEELYHKLGLKTVTVFSSLEEPLFKNFGADRIIQLMRQLGMQEDEVIEHAMISRSIRNAQEKIGKKLLIEQSARSQEDWIKRNLPA